MLNSILGNNLENIQRTLYNNINESEEDISGKEKQSGQANRNVFEQSINEINTKSETGISKKTEFENKFKEAIKNRADESLLSENTKNKQIIKDIYGVDGDSMQPTLYEDDIIIVYKQENTENGQIAIVLINNEESTEKKIISK